MAARGGHITMTWVPDPVVYSDAILSVSEALRDTRLPLLFAQQHVQADIKERFITKTDPDGNPWEPWAESYEPRALSHPNIDLLRRDDDLYQAATDDSAFTVNDDTLFYHAENLPEYGIWHQEGRPARRTKSGAPNPLPKRAFLGMSRVTEGVIFRSFSLWFEEALDLFMLRRGGVGRRHARRSAGTGQFIPNP